MIRVLLPLLVASLGCAVTVKTDASSAKPTQTFPEPWSGGETQAAAVETNEPEAETKAEESDAAAAAASGAAPSDAKSENLCCDSLSLTKDGSKLDGCRFVEATADAKNACVDGGKTFKECQAAECTGATCRCSN